MLVNKQHNQDMKTYMAKEKLNMKPQILMKLSA